MGFQKRSLNHLPKINDDCGTDETEGQKQKDRPGQEEKRGKHTGQIRSIGFLFINPAIKMKRQKKESRSQEFGQNIEFETQEKVVAVVKNTNKQGIQRRTGNTDGISGMVLHRLYQIS